MHVVSIVSQTKRQSLLSAANRQCVSTLHCDIIIQFNVVLLVTKEQLPLKLSIAQTSR